MGNVYNRPEQKEYRRELRKLQSRAEKMLWRRIRDRQIKGCKFRRQHGIEKYIVDFYCPEFMLAIEIDGPHHLEQVEADQIRQRRIESHGVRFLRFTDEDVIKNYPKVLEVISKEIDRLSKRRSGMDELKQSDTQR
jgi:very-short-patch-repair endonuclease